MKPRRAGKTWTYREDNQLKKLFFQGRSIGEIAEIHNREEDSVVFRLIDLGVLGYTEDEIHGTTGMSWSQDEMNRLKREFNKGYSIEEIAKKHKRQKNVILHKLVSLRLVDFTKRDVLEQFSAACILSDKYAQLKKKILEWKEQDYLVDDLLERLKKTQTKTQEELMNEKSINDTSNNPIEDISGVIQERLAFLGKEIPILIEKMSSEGATNEIKIELLHNIIKIITITTTKIVKDYKKLISLIYFLDISKQDVEKNLNLFKKTFHNLKRPIGLVSAVIYNSLYQSFKTTIQDYIETKKLKASDVELVELNNFFNKIDAYIQAHNGFLAMQKEDYLFIKKEVANLDKSGDVIGIHTVDEQGKIEKFVFSDILLKVEEKARYSDLEKMLNEGYNALAVMNNEISNLLGS